MRRIQESTVENGSEAMVSYVSYPWQCPKHEHNFTKDEAYKVKNLRPDEGWHNEKPVSGSRFTARGEGRTWKWFH